MADRALGLGLGTGDLAIEQWRSFSERVESVAITTEVVGRAGRTDHSELLLDRLIRGHHDGIVIPTRHLPLTLPDPVELKAVAPRRTPLAAVFAYDNILLDEFGEGAVIGVEGPLQAAQLMFYRPDLRVVVVPGAVRDRMQALDDEAVDALVMPAAYAEWLGIQDRVSEILPSDIIMPVAGQGTLSLVGRSGDDVLAPLIEALDQALARREVEAERGCVRTLREGGGALSAALMRQQGEFVSLEATVVDFGGRRRFHHSMDGERDDAPGIARRLAEELLGHLKAALVDS